MSKLIGAALLMAGLSATAFATIVPSAPEIDPASAISALTLLAGALTIVRGRRSSK